MNGDGRKDLVAGDCKGKVWIYLDRKTAGEPELDAGKPLLVDGRILNSEETAQHPHEEGEAGHSGEGRSHAFAEDYAKIHLADWNGDGLGDIIAGYAGYTLQVFLNSGTMAEPVFKSGLGVELEAVSVPIRPSPFMYDWDGDGKRDLLVGTEQGQVQFYANVGEEKAPKFAEGVDIEAGGLPLDIGVRLRVFACDWNSDGTADLVVGSNYTLRNPDLPRGREIRGNIWLLKGRQKEKAPEGEKPQEGK